MANLVLYRKRQLHRLENERSQFRRGLFWVYEVIKSLSCNSMSLNEIIRCSYMVSIMNNKNREILLE